MSKLSQSQNVISEVNGIINSLKKTLIAGIKQILKERTDKEHTFIELNSPVTINLINADIRGEITRVYRDGGVVTQPSYGEENNEQSIDDLNVSQLFDLLIQLNEVK